MKLSQYVDAFNENSFDFSWPSSDQNTLLILDPNFENWKDVFNHPCLEFIKSGFLITFSRSPHTFAVFNELSKRFEFRDHIVWHDPQPQWVSNDLALRVTEDIMVFRAGSVKSNMKVGPKTLAAPIPVNKGKSSIGRWTSDQQRTYTPNERAHLTTLITEPRNLTAALGRWQKPNALARTLVEAYSQNDWVVFDPFCGSGSFLWAAQQLERKAIGVELDPANFNSCVSRFLQQSLQFSQAESHNGQPQTPVSRSADRAQGS